MTNFEDEANKVLDVGKSDEINKVKCKSVFFVLNYEKKGGKFTKKRENMRSTEFRGLWKQKVNF